MWDYHRLISMLMLLRIISRSVIFGSVATLWSILMSSDSRQAGAMLANGLIHSGVRTEMDAALALLSEHVEAKSVPLRVAAIIGFVSLSPSLLI